MYWFDEESKTLMYWYNEEDEAIQALEHLEIAEDWKDAEHRWDDVCEREIKEALWWANECSEANRKLIYELANELHATIISL